MEKETALDVPFEKNLSAIYAATRNALYRNGKITEILANYNNKLIYLSEWWKQLYGESEGKEHKGIFPASVNFTADLHSMGQYIQEGTRNIFEIIISIAETNHTLRIAEEKEDLDQLNFLAKRRVDEVNKMAELGTILAHVDGGVPNIRIEIPKLDEYSLGELIYFFEKACGISGYLLGVNPFNQPGVEAYKKNMFALLQKPGFEEETRKINERLTRGKTKP
jgi:glucose-6-phosphate isomerase